MTAVQDSTVRDGGQATARSGEGSDPGHGSQPVDGSAGDADLLLIVEATHPESGHVAGGALQETPVEQRGLEGSDSGSTGPDSAQGAVYSWQDGDRTLGARLQLDLVATPGGAVRSKEGAPADGGTGQAARRSDTSGGSDTYPVFRSESGELMTLPGGVLLVLDPEWEGDEVAGFFAANGIDPGRVSELGGLTNGFFVETEPGFASLDLANSLAGRPGVELSSPNWLRERSPA